MLRRIAVIADDVYILITGIPARVLCVPYPDEVVKTVLVGELVIHKLPELNISVLSARAPPEPLVARPVRVACCLVERSPQYRNVSVSSCFQLLCHMVDVGYKSIIALLVFTAHSLGKVKVCILRVECLPPCTAVILHILLRRIPVPAQRYYTALVVYPVNSLQRHHISAACTVCKSAVREVEHIKTQYSRSFTCVLLYLLELTAILALVVARELTRDNVLSVNIGQEVEKPLSLIGSVRI